MKVFRKCLSGILLALFYASCLQAQQVYTLEQVIALARQQSVKALQAKNRKETGYWAYKVYLAEQRPQLSLSGTLPDYNRSILTNRNDDGSIGFIPVSNLNTDIGLRISQKIGWTGGEVFLNSSLARLENLSGNFAGVQYSSVPLRIGFEQPLFGFNALKWDKKIEPLKYEESTKKFHEDLESIASESTDLFFNLLIARANLEIALTNKAKHDTLFQIAQQRFELGTLSENDLLQLNLQVINASQDANQAKLDIELSQLKLKSFLGMNTNFEDIILEIPYSLPDFSVNPLLAIEKAKEHRQAFISFQRQKLEAQRDLAEAQKNSKLNLNIFGSFGFTQSADRFLDTYLNPQNQQVLQIGFQIPVIDWGKQKAGVKTATANQELVLNQVEIEKTTFEQEIFLYVKQLELFREKVIFSKQLDEIAQKRYAIAYQRFLISKISVTDLNIALSEKDTAKQSYLNALYKFWQSYFLIRKLTLFDFEKNIPITHP